MQARHVVKKPMVYPEVNVRCEDRHLASRKAQDANHNHYHESTNSQADLSAGTGITLPPSSAGTGITLPASSAGTGITLPPS